ncbi:MAG: hypothetical protein OXD42_13030 [Rhodospirillaceae bacterium]|nr:hypothetical protein [Rhodospirillaceae bacterium]
MTDELEAFQRSGRMLQVATDLHRAAEILDRVRKESSDGKTIDDFTGTLHGSPILWAQSAEIALKALWYIGHGLEQDDPSRADPLRSHNLTKLHDDLTKEVQKRLASEFPEIPDPVIPHFPIPYRKGLRAILCEHETALVEWRYTYEHNGLRFEHVFTEVLTTVLKVGWDLHNQWILKLRHAT